MGCPSWHRTGETLPSAPWDTGIQDSGFSATDGFAADDDGLAIVGVWVTVCVAVAVTVDRVWGVVAELQLESIKLIHRQPRVTKARVGQ